MKSIYLEFLNLHCFVNYVKLTNVLMNISDSNIEYIPYKC